MEHRVHHHYQALLEEDGLPADTPRRAERFLREGNKEKLWSLPLSSEEMYKAGTVIAHATFVSSYPSDSTPITPLPDSLRKKLHVLFEEGSPHSEAALFVLSRDLQVRALNRALADQQT